MSRRSTPVMACSFRTMPAFWTSGRTSACSRCMRQSACPKGRIYAFEPMPPLIATLRHNAYLHNGMITVFPIGVSDREGLAEFKFYPHNTIMSGRKSAADVLQDQAVVENVPGQPGGRPRPGIAGPVGRADHSAHECRDIFLPPAAPVRCPARGADLPTSTC